MSSQSITSKQNITKTDGHPTLTISPKKKQVKKLINSDIKSKSFKQQNQYLSPKINHVKSFDFNKEVTAIEGKNSNENIKNQSKVNRKSLTKKKT